MEDWRDKVVEETKSWLLTPWHHLSDIKGAGVDCAQLIRMVYINAGLVDMFKTEDYPQDFMLNRGEERFLAYVEKYMYRVDKPQKADVAIWMYGRCFSHGAVVIEWPTIIHAYRKERGVVWGDASRGEFIDREVRFYTRRMT